MADAPDQWVVLYGMGGYVCSECGMPTESEPCADHQPNACARMSSDPGIDYGELGGPILFSGEAPDHPAPSFHFSHGGLKYSEEAPIKPQNREDNDR
jgi:hypothetical protein